jgi:hypothetical protein
MISNLTKLAIGMAFKPEKREHPNLQGQAGTIREFLTQRDNDPAHKMTNKLKSSLPRKSMKCAGGIS